MKSVDDYKSSWQSFLEQGKEKNITHPNSIMDFMDLHDKEEPRQIIEFSYQRESINYFDRASRLLNSSRENTSHLFYAALELRFGVETRMREYLKHQQNVSEKRKKGWKIAALSQDIKNAFSGVEKELVFSISAAGENNLVFRYRPVVPGLRTIAEKLGNYLHAAKDNELNSNEEWQQFRQLIEEGIKFLAYACSGSLLGVPMISPSFKGRRGGRLYLTVSPEEKIKLSEIVNAGREVLTHIEYLEVNETDILNELNFLNPTPTRPTEET